MKSFLNAMKIAKRHNMYVYWCEYYKHYLACSNAINKQNNKYILIISFRKIPKKLPF